MKHNLISVIQMCDQVHKVTFNSQKCEIRREGLGNLVSTTARTSNDIYVLSEIGNEKCCLGKCRAADIPCKSTFNCQPGKVDLEEPAQEMQG
jgi:hypothetical protein